MYKLKLVRNVSSREGKYVKLLETYLATFMNIGWVFIVLIYIVFKSNPPIFDILVLSQPRALIK